MKNKGKILIVSGPSGCGKSTVLSKVFEGIPRHFFSISATTRSPRPGEKDGVDYYFISREEFEKMMENGEFLEHAEFVGNCYGTPIKPIYEYADKGYTVILDIETKGFMQVKKKIPEAVSIFIAPPSLEELEKRLRGRGTEPEEKIKKRLEEALNEKQLINLYDYVIVNDDVDNAAKMILNILDKD